MKLSMKFAALALCFAGSAQAGLPAQAQAGLSNIGFELIDLDLDDGIAPSISFSNFVNSSNSMFVDANDASLNRTSSQITANAAATSSQVALPGAAASAYFTGDALASSVQMNRFGSYSSRQEFNRDFTLSANTLLLVYGNSIVDTPASFIGQYPNRYSEAGVLVSLRDTSHLPNGTDQFTYFNQSVANYAGTSHAASDFNLAFINQTQAVLHGKFNISTSVYSNVTAVPEPETYLMMLAGLGLIVGIARRRALRQAR